MIKETALPTYRESAAREPFPPRNHLGQGFRGGHGDHGVQVIRHDQDQFTVPASDLVVASRCGEEPVRYILGQQRCASPIDRADRHEEGRTGRNPRGRRVVQLAATGKAHAKGEALRRDRTRSPWPEFRYDGSLSPPRKRRPPFRRTHAQTAFPVRFGRPRPTAFFGLKNQTDPGPPGTAGPTSDARTRPFQTNIRIAFPGRVGRPRSTAFYRNEKSDRSRPARDGGPYL